MEEPELHPSGAQRVVERREDDVAHARGHLPEDRAAVVEEHLPRQQQTGPGCEPRALGVAVLVAEHEVVHDPDQRRLDGLRPGTVTRQPFAVVLVVDRRVALGAGHEPVDDDAAHDRAHEVEEVPHAAGRVVAADALGERVAQAGHHDLDRAQREGGRGTVERFPRRDHAAHRADRFERGDEHRVRG